MMPEPTSTVDDPSEADLYWAGASGWAMLPGLVVGSVLSAIGMFGLPPLGAYVGLPVDWSAFVLFWLAMLGWASLGLMWAYRGSSLVYRLTSKHLFIDYGRFYRPTPPVPLGEIRSITVRAWALRRLFGVGAVTVHCDGRDVRMRGIFRPEKFAEAIQSAINRLRAEEATAERSADRAVVESGPG